MASLSVDKSATAALPECEKLDIASVKRICKGNQVMIYGTGDCKYRDVFRILDRMKRDDKRPPFEKVFNWSIACCKANSMSQKTAEGRSINLIPFQKSVVHPQVTSRPCKTAITDLVLENYKRIEEGRAAIPLIFCIDIDDNPNPLMMKHIADPSSQGITIKELRRAYKLCTHVNPKIRRAAEETLKFVKMKYLGDETYGMEQIAAPWADANAAAELWKSRISASRSRTKESSVNWRIQLEARIAEYEDAKPKTHPPILFPTITTALPIALVSLAMKKATEASENYKSERSLTRIGEDS